MSRRARIIGLTGQSGAGKTTVARVFEEKGFEIIDADAVSRKVVQRGSPCLKELSEAFGKGIITDSGTLDRKKLGSIVFSDKEKLRQLDSIIYPYIIFRIIMRIDSLEKTGTEYILLDAPTLFEADADDLCDVIVSVTAGEKLRAERIIKRDGISEEAAHKRFASQHSEHFFITHSDFVINNNGSPEELSEKAAEAADRIKEYFDVG